MLDNIYLDKTQINFTSGYTLTKQKLGGTYLGVLKIDVIKFDYERKKFIRKFNLCTSYGHIPNFPTV